MLFPMLLEIEGFLRMSNESQDSAAIKHLLAQLQSQLNKVENKNAPKPGLHWGQFVLESKTELQVGLYGSAGAAIVLRMWRDDDAARNSAENLIEFVKSKDSELELAHNIKLAMVCLALAPSHGEQASIECLNNLDKLLTRRSSVDGFWPAYSRPNTLQNSGFVEQPSAVATSIIIIFLKEVGRKLAHQSHREMQGRIAAILDDSVLKLEGAISAKRKEVERYGSLFATAAILVRGKRVQSTTAAIFAEATQQRDFADRRVFFYDCLRQDSQLAKDYFILPVAALLPVVAGEMTAGAYRRAQALDVARGLLKEVDDNGIFKGGQELPSTVEQALIALSLSSAVRGFDASDHLVSLSWAWQYMLQPKPNGAPTKFVISLMICLWIIVAALIFGRYIPDGWKDVAGVGLHIENFSKLAKKLPSFVTDFLIFFVGVLPASRLAFLHLIRMGRS